MNTSLRILAALSVLTFFEEAAAQSDSTRANSNFFSAFSTGYAGTAPKITANSYHLGFYLGRDGANYWDLYLFNSVPTVAPTDVDTIEYVSNDIRRQLGGIANFSLAKVGYFGYGDDRSLRDIKGFQVDFRFGVKLVDTPIRQEGTDFLIPMFQSSFDFRYLIPLIEARKANEDKNAVDLRKSMVGNLSFRISGAFMYVFNSQAYDIYYTSRKGILPSQELYVITPEMFFYITDQIYFGAGYYFNSQDYISNNLFISISYGKQVSRP